MNIKRYLKYERTLLKEFGEFYKEMNRINPNQFSLNPYKTLQEWRESFLDFVEGVEGIEMRWEGGEGDEFILSSYPR